MKYSQFLPLRAPSWLQDAHGTAFLGAIGALFDDAVADAKAASKQHLPGSTFSDALPALGDERQIDRGTNDSDQQYGSRLAGAWSTWSLGGSGLSILTALAALGYTSSNGNPTLVQQNGLYLQLDASGNLVSGKLSIDAFLPGSPGWWTFDANTAFYQRFALLFPSLPSGWSSVNPSPTYGAPTKSEVNTIRRTVNKWRDGARVFVGIVVPTSGKILGWPVRSLGGGNGTLGGSVVVWGGAEE